MHVTLRCQRQAGGSLKQSAYIWRSMCPGIAAPWVAVFMGSNNLTNLLWIVPIAAWQKVFLGFKETYQVLALMTPIVNVCKWSHFSHFCSAPCLSQGENHHKWSGSVYKKHITSAVSKSKQNSFQHIPDFCFDIFIHTSKANQLQIFFFRI